MKKYAILLLVFLGGIILAAGCTGTAPAGTTPQVIPPATGTVTLPLTPVPADTFWPKASRAGEFTTVPTTRPAADNPHLDLLDIRKRTFTDPLPDCIMEQAFPEIGLDSAYGIRQVVPKLAAVSEEDYEAFLRKYTEGDAENTKLVTPAVCQNTENEPVWNFIEVRLVLTPTNIDPSDYTITANVFSEGEIVSRFTSTERLVIDRQLVLARYVPIHADEVDLFDSVQVEFTRH